MAALPAPVILVKEISDGSVVLQTRSWVKGAVYGGRVFPQEEGLEMSPGRLDQVPFQGLLPQRPVAAYPPSRDRVSGVSVYISLS